MKPELNLAIAIIFLGVILGDLLAAFEMRRTGADNLLRIVMAGFDGALSYFVAVNIVSAVRKMKKP